MGSFLIPANTKKSMLIFGLFTVFDIIMFGIGIAITILLLLTLPVDTFIYAIIALIPALVTGFLVLPVPNYHNMLTVIKSAINFFFGRREFIWKGWCYPHGEETKK